MPTVSAFNRRLHDIPLRVRGYFNLVEHMYDVYHGQQTRLTGEPYAEHLCDVMRQLMEIKSDDPTSKEKKLPWENIIAGGLHDIIEDTAEKERPVTKEMLAQIFGEEEPEFGEKVAFYTDSWSKRPLSLFDGDEEARIHEFQTRFLLALECDYRVIFGKLCDRRHNLFTLHGLPEDMRERVSIDTLDFYIPLALGRAKELVPKGFHYWLEDCAHQMTCVSLAFLGKHYRVEHFLRITSPV